MVVTGNMNPVGMNIQLWAFQHCFTELVARCVVTMVCLSKVGRCRFTGSLATLFPGTYGGGSMALSQQALGHRR